LKTPNGSAWRSSTSSAAASDAPSTSHTAFSSPAKIPRDQKNSGGQAGVSYERLKVLEKSTNGFEIAEADLALRGPGSFFGTRQSGLPDVAMENLTNLKLVELARKEATSLLQTDPSLEHHPLLLETLKRFEEKIHLE
jgi:hypothetical protein